jgi:hypothetical protein
MLKKITIMLLVALVMVSGTAGAVLLNHNSNWKANIVTGPQYGGSDSDIYAIDELAVMYTYGKEITGSHTKMHWNITYVDRDQNKTTENSGIKTITEGDRTQNNPFLNVKLDKEGLWILTLKLNTGEVVQSALYVKPDDMHYQDFKYTSYHDKEPFLEWLDEYYFN